MTDGEARSKLVTEPGEILVDARGHRCPVPTLRLRRAVERAPAGARLRLIADDPMARIDAPHFAAEAGLEILSLAEDSGAIALVVRKPLGKAKPLKIDAARRWGERRAARMILLSS